MLIILLYHRQKHIVTSTNFRIDNILFSTRFSELPEQAQRELDQLEQYIRAESQRCEFVKKQGVHKHGNLIQSAQQQTDSLYQVHMVLKDIDMRKI